MAKSRNVQALNDIEALMKSQDISSLDISQPGGGAVVAMASQEIVPANGPRLVRLSNISAAGVLFFQRDSDAVTERGDALPAGDSVVIPLGDGQSLNAIASAGNVKVAFQVYG